MPFHIPSSFAIAAMAVSVAMFFPMGLAVGEERSTVHVENREHLVRALATAEAGTTILLAPRTYSGGIAQANLQGTRERPIVIAAADPARPPVFEGGGSGLQLSDPAFVELRDLVFAAATGNGLNIDDGGSKATPAHRIRLVALVVREVGPKGNCDGIKLSGVDGFHIQNCTLERWGDRGSGSDMVGCHRGTIEGCTLRHGENTAASNGVQAKGGTSTMLDQLEANIGRDDESA